MISFLTLALLLPIPFCRAAPTNTKRAITPLLDGSAISGQMYDYVIAGGGLAGSVLASRLSEDSGRTVLVIEAGYDEEGNTGVTDASRYQSTFNSAIDWAYQTVPQTTANGRTQTIRAGKALGGSTTINGLAWSKPHTFQIDAMESLGNTGLSWASLQGYMLRAENFQPPSSSQAGAGVTYSSSCHAGNGPIGIQYDPNSSPDNLERDFNSSVLALGLPYATDLTCGNPAGAAPISNTRVGNTRIDACESPFRPFYPTEADVWADRGYLFGKTRPNLTILSGANVGKVLLSASSPPRATGIEFRDRSNRVYTVNANLEVIMAAGSIKTPTILQQSGIGPSNVLRAAGVTQRVDLPVGLNLIDQTTTTTDWNFRGARGGGQVITFPRFQDLFKGADATTMRNILQNDLGSYAQAAVNAGAASSASGLQRVLEIQRDWILNNNAGISENFDYSFGTTLGYDSWYLLPFGRGSITIQNNQPYSNAISINPRYFSTPFDRLAQGATARFTRTVSTSTPLNRDLTGEAVPGGSVPTNGNLESWASWAQANYRSNWHPIGTAAMMSRDLGGSVDSRNRLYGVNSLRVVDGSTLPFQVSSHLMSVLYGLAERASDLIKADHPNTTPPPPPPSGNGAIHPNGDATKCLEVQGSTLANGIPVDISDCTGNSNQRWQITRGTGAIQVQNSNYCLDAGSSPASGIKMKIWTCYSGIPAQTWTYGTDNLISVVNRGQCLDLTDGVKTNGNVVQTWSCSAGNNNQKWTL